MYCKFSLPLLLSAFVSFSEAAVHQIDVGKGGQRFTPEKVENVAAGDILIFTLFPQHNVIQGDFSSPCTPSNGGFFSGPFSDTDNGKKRFVVNVTGEGPWYWYCGVQKHCQSGMVGGADLPSTGNTLDAYKNNAKNVQNSETPSSLSGGALVDEAQISSLTASGTSSVAATATSGSASASVTSSKAPTTATGSSTGSPSSSGSAPTSSSTGAAHSFSPGHASTGAFGLVLGLVGWLL